MFENDYHPSALKIIPSVFMSILGSLLISNYEKLFWVGVLLILFAFILVGWMVIHDIIREARLHTQESTDLILARARLAETVGSLNSNSKAELGLIDVPDQTTVKFDRTQQIGGEYNVQYPIFSVSPVELRELAQICWVQGVPFSLRKLSGSGNLLSDAKFRKLQEELLDHGLIEYKDPKHVTLGLDWTEEGRVFLQELAEA